MRERPLKAAPEFECEEVTVVTVPRFLRRPITLTVTLKFSGQQPEFLKAKAYGES